MEENIFVLPSRLQNAIRFADYSKMDFLEVKELDAWLEDNNITTATSLEFSSPYPSNYNDYEGFHLGKVVDMRVCWD